MKRSRDQQCQRVDRDWGNHDETEDKMFQFEPALHIQRKRKVLDTVMRYIYEKFPNGCDNPDFRIVDVGCERGAFFQYMQNELIGIENKFDTEYIGIDISEFTLSNMTIENLRYNNMICKHDIRNGNISVKLVEENILNPSYLLDRPDALVMIEVIEHIPLKDVNEKLPESIFGIVCPQIAVITTPNQDFNEIFGMKSRIQFRHFDHKFEWTRSEFKKWCNKVKKCYPSYDFVIEDIGTSSLHPNNGGGTQMAIFTRNCDRPKEPSEKLIQEANIVFERINFYEKQSEEAALKKFLSDQLSKWAISKYIPDFFDFNNGKMSKMSDEDENDVNYTQYRDSPIHEFIEYDFNNEDYDNNNMAIDANKIDDDNDDDNRDTKLVYDDMTGIETFSVRPSVAIKAMKLFLPNHKSDIDFDQIIKNVCEDHTFFKYNLSTDMLEYVSGSGYDSLGDEYNDKIDELTENFSGTQV